MPNIFRPLDHQSTNTNIVSAWVKFSRRAFFILAGSLTLFIVSANATPPATTYAPGETLSPSCSPGDPNCTVTPPAESGENTNITSFTGGNIGIGLTSPVAKLDIAGDINIATSSSIRQGGIRLIKATYTSPESLFVGFNTGVEDYTGYYYGNTFIGNFSGSSITAAGAKRDTLIGHGVAPSLTSGQDNTVVGAHAANALTTGHYNQIFGTYAAFSLTTGQRNVFLGEQAGYTISSGGYNVMVGNQTSYIGGSDGSYNAYLGYRAGYSAKGSNNVFIGHLADSSTGLATSSIAIGNAANVSGSYQLSIGNLIYGTGLDGTGTTISSGNIGIGTTSPGAKLDVAGNTIINSVSGAPLIVQYGSAARLTINDSTSVFANEIRGGTVQLGNGGLIVGSGGSLGMTVTGTSVNDLTITSDSGAGYSAANIDINGLGTGLSVGQAGAGDIFNLFDGTIAAGTKVFTIKDGGNVGIGTTSPGTKLHLYDASNDVTVKVQATSNTKEAALALYNDSYYSAFELFGSSYNVAALRNAALFSLQSGASKLEFATLGDAPITFHTNAGPNAASNEWMRITSAGNVGIGTTAPGALLELKSTSGVIFQIKNSANKTAFTISDSDLKAKFYSEGSIDTAALGFLGTTGLGYNGGSLSLITDNTARMVVQTTTGNVGIGTTAPTAPLHIYTSTSAALVARTENASFKLDFGVDGTSSYVQSRTPANAAAPLYFYTGGTANMVISSTGNVGIGTTTPGAKLEIGSGQVFLPNGAVATPSLSFSNDPDTGIYATGSNGLRIGTGGNLTYGYEFNGVGAFAGSSMMYGWASSYIGTAADTAFSRGGAAKIYVGNGTAGDYSGTLIAGNVGIGTTNSSAVLHVKGAGAGTMRIEGTATEADIKYSDSSSNYWFAGLGAVSSNSSWGIWEGGGAGRLNIVAGGNMGIGYDNPGTAKLAINGNVGIGTTSPNYELHVKGTGQTTAALTDSGNSGAMLLLDDIGTNYGNGGAVGFGANNFGHPFAAIKGLLQGSGNTIGDIAFATRNLGSDTALTERMRITYGGNVGIGTTTPNAKLDLYATANSTLLRMGGLIGGQTVNFDYKLNEDALDPYNLGVATDGHAGKLYTTNEAGTFRQAMVLSDINTSQAATIFGISASVDSGATWNPRFVIQQSGNVGIGTTEPGTLLDVIGTTTLRSQLAVNGASLTDNNGKLGMGFKMDASLKSGLFVTDNFSTSSFGAFISAVVNSRTSWPNANALYLGNGIQTTSASTATGNGFAANSQSVNGTNAFGTGNYYSQVSTVNAVNTGTSYGYVANNYIQGNGTANAALTNYIGFYSRGQMAVATPTVTNHYDFYADNYNSAANGVITNRYGVYLGYNTTGVTNAYGMYQVDSGVKNYFAGNVGIGTTSPGEMLNLYSASANPTILVQATGATKNAFLVLDGGQGSPTIQFKNATVRKWSIYNSSSNSDAFQFDDATGNRLTIQQTTGNVGIGTTTPDASLVVRGTTGLSTIVQRIWNSNVSWGGEALIRAGSDTENLTKPAVDFGSYIGAANLGFTNSGFIVKTGTQALTTTKFIIQQDGNIGIGTTSPGAKLSLGSSLADTKLAIYDDGTNFVGFGYQGDNFRIHTYGVGGNINFYAGSSALVTFKGTGNVGIGTTSPLARLAIKGSGNTSASQNLLLTNSDNTALVAVLNDGNVGIGIINPAAKLNVVDTVAQEWSKPFLIYNPNITAGQHVQVGFGVANSAYNQAEFNYNYVGGAGSTSNTFSLGLHSAADILTIKGTGNVGISVTAPDAFKLQVAGSIGPNADNSYTLGSSAAKWSDVWVVNNHVGDLLFANDFRFTEIGDIGLALKSAQGDNLITFYANGDIAIGSSTNSIMADIKGLENEIDALKLTVEADSSGLLTVQSPIITPGDQFAIDEQGYVIIAKIKAEDVKSKRFGVVKGEKLDENMIGEAIVAAGMSSTTVENLNISTDSKIFITWYSDIGTAQHWICERRAGKSFDLCLNQPAVSELKFDYMIIDVSSDGSQPIIEPIVEATPQSSGSLSVEVPLVEEPITQDPETPVKEEVIIPIEEGDAAPEEVIVETLDAVVEEPAVEPVVESQPEPAPEVTSPEPEAGL